MNANASVSGPYSRHIVPVASLRRPQRMSCMRSSIAGMIGFSLLSSRPAFPGRQYHRRLLHGDTRPSFECWPRSDAILVVCQAWHQSRVATLPKHNVKNHPAEATLLEQGGQFLTSLQTCSPSIHVLEPPCICRSPGSDLGPIQSKPPVTPCRSPSAVIRFLPIPTLITNRANVRRQRSSQWLLLRDTCI